MLTVSVVTCLRCGGIVKMMAMAVLKNLLLTAFGEVTGKRIAAPF